MNFFDQIQEALEKQQSPEWTPLPLTSQEQQKTTTSPEQLITLQPRTKTAKDTFVCNYPKTVMAQPPDHQTEDIYPSQEEILSVTDYMKAVWWGRIQKSSQPPPDRRFGEAAPCQPDQSYCSNL